MNKKLFWNIIYIALSIIALLMLIHFAGSSSESIRNNRSNVNIRETFTEVAWYFDCQIKESPAKFMSITTRG